MNVFSGILLATGGSILIVAMLFVLVILSTLVGGFAGWTVDLVFPFVVSALNQVVGTQLTGFEMGAVLGFIGSFFRNTKNESKKD